MSNQVINIGAAPLVVNGQPLGGGFSFAYDLGGSTIDYASQAFNFLEANNRNNQSFLNSSIVGTQDFLAHQSSPLLDAIVNQTNLNVTQSASDKSVATQFAYDTGNTIAGSSFAGGVTNLFSNQIQSQNASLSALTSQSISQIGANVSSSNQASQNIASSNASSGSFCFITTAICQSENKPDDCEELTVLRNFRDNYMMETSERKTMILEYYEKAPSIVARIDAREDRKAIYSFIRRFYLENAMRYIRMNCYQCALVAYRSMIHYCEGL